MFKLKLKIIAFPFYKIDEIKFGFPITLSTIQDIAITIIILNRKINIT